MFYPSDYKNHNENSVEIIHPYHIQQSLNESKQNQEYRNSAPSHMGKLRPYPLLVHPLDLALEMDLDPRLRGYNKLSIWKG